MRIVTGKHVREMDARELAAWRERYQEIVVDLGAGDGRFIRELAGRNQAVGAIGVDLCAANLRAASRTAGENALFVVADALALPQELHGVASRVTAHFPWGSLLRALLSGDPELLAGLRHIGSGQTCYEIILNAGAVAEAGWAFEPGSEQVREHLRKSGFRADAMRALNPAELRSLPNTWAKRLAFGRDPRALHIRATKPASRSDTHHPFPITHRPAPPSATLPHWPARSRSIDAYVSLSAPPGRVSAQPHRRARGASPQEGGLVARTRTRAPQI